MDIAARAHAASAARGHVTLLAGATGGSRAVFLLTAHCNHPVGQVFTNLYADAAPGAEDGGFDAYRDATALLFESLTDPVRQRAVINADDPHAAYLASKVGAGVPVVFYSAQPPERWAAGGPTPDVYPTVADLSLFDTVLEVATPAGAVKIVSMLLGSPNVANTCAAVAVGAALGVSLDRIADGVQSLLNGVPGRLEFVDEKQEFAVIIDSAGTPAALQRTLNTVRECGAARVITVFGCDGGGDAAARPVMGRIAHDLSDVVVVTSTQPRDESVDAIAADVVSSFDAEIYSSPAVVRREADFPFLKDWEAFRGGGYRDDHMFAAMQLQSVAKRFVIADRFYAIRAALGFAGEGDAVVLAGRGAAEWMDCEGARVYFSDAAECRYLLRLLVPPDGSTGGRPATLDMNVLPYRCKGWPTDMNDFINGYGLV